MKVFDFLSNQVYIKFHGQNGTVLFRRDAEDAKEKKVRW